MTNEHSRSRVAFVVANEGIEQVELTEPWKAVEAAGGTPTLVAPKAGTAQAMHHLDKADTFPVDRTTAEVTVDDFDAVVLPGGVANPDALRTDEAAVGFVRAMTAAGKPVAAICHGPWTLIEADVVRGRTVTSWPSLRTDIVNAGGSWVDEQVQVCTDGPNTLITSRKPDDLEAFSDALNQALATTEVSAGTH
jgi:protease I